MKKLLFFTMTIGYCLGVTAGNHDSLRVDTNDSSFIIQKLTIKKSTAILILQNGDKISMNLDKINCYSANGKVFKKLPLYIKGQRTCQFVFMELVKIQGELNLYKYSNWSYNPNFKLTNFLLYCGEKMVMEFDESSHP